MDRRGGLNVAVPKLRQHMLEQRCALTCEMAAEILGVTKPTAYNFLFYMETTGIVQRVTRVVSYYFLKDTYDEDQIEIILRKSGARERRAKPKKWVRHRRQRNVNLIEEHMAGVREQADSGEEPSALAILGITHSGSTELQAPTKKITRPIEPKKNLGPQPFGTISMLPKNMRRITSKQIRYLKDNYLKDWAELDHLNTFFVAESALKRGEYGTVIFASMGTNSWERVTKLTLGPSMTPLPEVENRRWEGWAAFTKGLKPLDKPRYKKNQYGQILDQFLEGGHECVRVTVEDRDPNYIRTVLATLITERGLGGEVAVDVVNQALYLERNHDDC